MINPFEDEDARYVVLRNDEHQYSLWPVLLAVPEGWEQVHGEDTRQSCLDYVEATWTDLRPRSLVEAMNAAARPGA
ncbi:MbtH-like protein [Kitasatospora sp. MMS16-BH015]|uniref:MbtH family protein n=1 Tax=Kitasatospora sp. MMS16-BH015 TaxID=2018025 RepID=UPI000CA13E3B|nr:MbtH family protein [Kitasatospora sp. MMS16-BH015]AUG76126.1 MbtH-like protein [Kitasatospora sp. MMS16-BH015]